MTDRWTSRRYCTIPLFARSAKRGSVLATIALAALAFLAPVQASAQCLLCSDAPPSSEIVTGERFSEVPLQIDIIADLDFSRLVAGYSGGSVTLDPHSGAGRTQGDVAPLGGHGFSGRVIVTGTPLRNVRISLPDSVTLTSTSGRTARVSDIQTGQSPVLRLGPTGRLEFAFGGKLELDGAADGDYRGRIPVTVSYE